jgi:hypothetical protein
MVTRPGGDEIPEAPKAGHGTARCPVTGLISPPSVLPGLMFPVYLIAVLILRHLAGRLTT